MKVVLRYKCLMDLFEDNNLKGDFPLMREERPIIALDFPSFDDVKDFLEHFPEDEKLYVKNRHGILLCHWSRNRSLSERSWTQHFLGFETARHSQYGALSHVCLGTFGT